MTAQGITKTMTNFFQRKSVAAYVVLLSVMILLRDIAGISLSKYILVAFCAVFFFLSSKSDMIYMLMFTFPLLCGLPGNYIMPIAMILYFVKTKSITQKQLFFCFFVVLMEIFACLFYDTINFPETLGYITTLMLFFCLLYDNDRYDYKSCINYYALGVTLTCAVIVIATISQTPSWQKAIASGELRFGEIEHGTETALNLTLNANSLAYISIVGISCCVVLLRCDGVNKIILAIETAVLVVSGLLTLSRTWVIVFALLCVLYVFSSGVSGKGILRIFAVLGLFVLIGYFVFRQFPEIFDGLINRFERDDVLTGNGRYEITHEYMEAFGKDVRTTLFGTGVTQYRDVMGIEESLHNSPVQILICYGLVGTVIFAFGWLLKPVKAIGKVKLLYWIPFICIVVFSTSLQMLNPWYLIYPHLISVYVLQTEYERKTKEQKCNTLISQ